MTMSDADTLEQRADSNYAQWIRQVISAARSSNSAILPLFESTVQEPRQLLASLVREAFTEPLTSRYTSAFAGGNPFVLASLAKSYGVAPGHIMCTTGATGAMAILYRALLKRGDHVLVETPGFDLLGLLAQERGAQVGSFRRPGGNFDLDVDRIAKALTPRTRLVVLTNLHNPSGLPAEHSALVALAGLAEARGFHVIVDEVYGDFATTAERPMPACAVSPRFISVSSLTKSFGLSTLRCGWIVADPAVITLAATLAARTEFGVSNLSHAIAAIVLEQPAPFRAYSDGVLQAARPVVERHLAEWRAAELVDGVFPASGCIVFPRLVGIDDTLAFAEQLLEQTGVSVVPGEFFGAAGHIRIGYGQPAPVLDKALGRLGETLLAARGARTLLRR